MGDTLSKLADLIAADTRRAAGSPCTVTVLLESLPTDEANDLQDALDDATIPGTMISRALIAMGHQVRSNTLQRHRRGECHCG